MPHLQWLSKTVYLKGSDAQKNLANEQAAFYKTLTADYGTQFKSQSNILASLQQAFEPILQAGPGQYGFTTAEDTSLRTSAADTIARNFSGAQTALNDTLAARGGGNTFLPSGADAQLQAGLEGSEAAAQSTASNQITQAGFNQGNQNFLSAAGILGGTAQQYNPLGYAGANTNAGNSAFGSATTLYNQGTAWQGALGGILGGAAGAFLGNPALGGILGSGGGTPGNVQTPQYGPSPDQPGFPS